MMVVQSIVLISAVEVKINTSRLGLFAKAELASALDECVIH